MSVTFARIWDDQVRNGVLTDKAGGVLPGLTLVWLARHAVRTRRDGSCPVAALLYWNHPKPWGPNKSVPRVLDAHRRVVSAQRWANFVSAVGAARTGMMVTDKYDDRVTKRVSYG